MSDRIFGGLGLALALWAVAIVGFVPPILIGPILRRRIAMRREEAGSTSD